MNHSDEMRRCLEECDIAGIRALWRVVAPSMPQPESDHKTLAGIHMARTQLNVISLRARAYSHRWLCDNGYPSQLPDELKPKAERMFPPVAEAVGLSIGTTSELMKAVLPQVEGSMIYAIKECYADKQSPDPPLVKRRMFEAKKRTIDKLLGTFRSKPW